MSELDYDEYAYISRPFDYTSPSNLAALPILFGLNPPEPQNARILELGCASGGNLIPFAFSHPESTCVGIDISNNQISDGLTTIKQLGLKNVSLNCCSIDAMPDELRDFDYVIAHGLFSWIPESLQAVLLQEIAFRLNHNGVAVVTHNCYPGWHQIDEIRNRLLRETENIEDSKEKVTVARQTLDSLTSSLDETDSSAEAILKEAAFLSDKEDHYLRYDHLNRYNFPTYIQDFAKMCQSAGLSYLGDCDLNLTFGFLYTEGAERPTKEDEMIQLQQSFDIQTNRRFRKSILCRTGSPIDYSLDQRYLEGLCYFSQVASHTEFSQQSINPGAVMEFTNYEGFTFQLEDPYAKILILALIQNAGAPMSFDELADRITHLGNLPNSSDASKYLHQSLHNLIAKNVIRTTIQNRNYSLDQQQYPRTTELVRFQARRGELVTSLRHQQVRLPAFEAGLIQYFDGTRTLPQIVDLLVQSNFQEFPDEVRKRYSNITNSDLLRLCTNCEHQFRQNALLY